MAAAKKYSTKTSCTFTTEAEVLEEFKIACQKEGTNVSNKLTQLMIEVLATNSTKTNPIGISFGMSSKESHKDCWKNLGKWEMLDRQEIKERVSSLPKEILPTIFHHSKLINQFVQLRMDGKITV